MLRALLLLIAVWLSLNLLGFSTSIDPFAGLAVLVVGALVAALLLGVGAVVIAVISAPLLIVGLVLALVFAPILLPLLLLIVVLKLIAAPFCLANGT